MRRQTAEEDKAEGGQRGNGRPGRKSLRQLNRSRRMECGCAEGMSVFSRNSLVLPVNLAECLPGSRGTQDGEAYADAKRIDH